MLQIVSTFPAVPATVTNRDGQSNAIRQFVVVLKRHVDAICLGNGVCMFLKNADYEHVCVITGYVRPQGYVIDTNLVDVF